MDNKRIEFMTLSTNEQKEKGKFKTYIQAFDNKALPDGQIDANIMEINTHNIDAKNPQNEILIKKLEGKAKLRLTESAIRRSKEHRQEQNNIENNR